MFTQVLQGCSNRSLLGFLAIGILSLAATPRLQAAPVTFEFHTTGASVTALTLPGPGGPPPFSVSEGDALSGRFTFEPATGSGVYPQASTLQLFLGGRELRMDFDVAKALMSADAPSRVNAVTSACSPSPTTS